ncbi:MAG TPA: helix-turn-helix transcriptional regulator [Candidatus Binataceae bacterium]|nr:helix-turn-helix transcriptional regulator [Candidatus Binataceae bacterium]
MMSKRGTFGSIIRDRRRQMDLTQEEVARRAKTSTPYIGHIESGTRHPSAKVLGRLADVLGFDRRELFLLCNPGARALLELKEPLMTKDSAWEEFRRDESTHRLHNISSREMHMLSQVALLGQVRSSRDFIYILNTIRQSFVNYETNSKSA